MSEYYFLSSLLPSLAIGHVPAIGFEEVRDLIAINLNEDDKDEVRRFLNLIDIENFRALFAGEPIDKRGNYTRDELVDSLQNYAWPGDVEFKWYLQDYLDKYKTTEERLENFALLLSRFLEVESHRKDEGFLKGYFQFEKQVRLCLLGFRAKRLGRDLAYELQYEDASDPIVTQLLAQKDAKTFEPPFEYTELKPIFESYANAPLALHRALYEFKFEQIQEFYGSDHFGLDRILGYMARLIIVERWLELDVQRGIEILDTIEREVQ